MKISNLNPIIGIEDITIFYIVNYFPLLQFFFLIIFISFHM